MGHDKAMLKLGDLTLLGRVVRELLAVERLEEVVVVGSRTTVPETALGSAVQLIAPGQAVHFVDDRWPGQGPLGGLVTGLGFLAGRRSSEPDGPPVTATVAVLSCDLPKLTGSSIATLFEVLEQDLDRPRANDDEDVLDLVMSAREGRPQPLHAVFHRAALAALERRFLAGERRLFAAVAELIYKVVPDESGSSDDADTPEDWARLAGAGGDGV